ncbi:hypothetical protein [Streptomyces albiaxialis]|uniref:hypothetical protein n=1 Tax=Streptomyces albiaxialis TaxID=329523 RepID=UPI0031D03B03
MLADDRLVCVLDGVTPPPDGRPTGCVHGVRWYVESLARRIVDQAGPAEERSLPEALARSIDQVRRAHEGRCDLSHPDTPSAAVAILRTSGTVVDHLVLCDCTILLEQRGGIHVRTDATRRDQRPRRMSPTGPLWKASVEPQAAFSAVAGASTLDGADGLRRAAVVTDGAARIQELGLGTWAGLLCQLDSGDVPSVLARLRAEERSRWQLGRARHVKLHDDFTAVVCRWA